MAALTRRDFMKRGPEAAAAGALLASGACGGISPDLPPDDPRTLTVDLDGAWFFRTDPDKRGEKLGWIAAAAASDSGWTGVAVPHTWQVAPDTADYRGPAWYVREFDVPAAWRGSIVRVEFQAAFHTADVWVNGRPAGRHAGRGYTAFCLDLTPHLHFGRRNAMAVRVDNSFDAGMLPRGASYDWAMDGGLTRPVSLLVTPPVFIEAVRVDALPEPGGARASIRAAVEVRNSGENAVELSVGWRVMDETNGLAVLEVPGAAKVSLRPGELRDVPLPEAVLERPRLWHFDRPRLYGFEAWISRGGRPVHIAGTSFGVRRIETRDAKFFLNDEPVRLMGVERMAGSHPRYGMAEPETWIRRDHEDLKELNCVFTRVHWAQDRRVLDFCDRHGILIQLEVPSWGPDTFKGMAGEPAPGIMENGLAQLRETIRRDRNHPCVFSWGLGNEVDGQNPPAQAFVRRMFAEAKRLDPLRPCTYASNSLQATPERDIAGELDFVSWNEYYESWFGGTVGSVRLNLAAIRAAFPGKPIVISEYGYCACTADRPEDDARRAEILRTHDAVFREFPEVAGLIFFCYNDYRTHIGDQGLGVLKQRVHGVVDIYGARKPSFEVLRREASPVERLEAKRIDGRVVVRLLTRRTAPAYALNGYTLRGIVYGNGGIPLEEKDRLLPDLAPGSEASVTIEIETRAAGRLRIDVLRPTGYSAATVEIDLDGSR
jgi:beta-galactosidase